MPLIQFEEIKKRALEIKEKYDELNKSRNGKVWTREQVMEGLVGDVGDLMKLVMAKGGVRKIENVDKKLAHELSDCLWSIVVLADRFEINLEKEFMKSMDELERRIAGELDQ